jgi:hypothetical protein
MKTKMLLAAGIVASACLAGCAISKQTPAQVAANVCPLLTSELDTLSQGGVFMGGAADTLTEKIIPGVDKVCAAGATVTEVNVRSVSSATAPLLISLVKASSLSSDRKATAIVVIGTAKGMIDTAFPPVVVTSAPASGVVVE